MATHTVNEKGILALIERLGNKMPHPIALFIGILSIVLILSLLFSTTGASAIHPQTGQTIVVKNMLSIDSIMNWLFNINKNLQNFPVLTSVIILTAATGLCEQTGFFSTAIKSSLKNASGHSVVFVIAFIGSCGNIAGDVAFLIVPSIAATIFLGVGRNPLVGLFLGYATVGGGYGTNFIPGGWDVILTPITIQSAQILDPEFTMNLVSGYFMMVVGTILVTLSASFVTIKYIEPKFGKYTGVPEGIEMNTNDLTDKEKFAFKCSLIALALYVLAIVISCIPSDSFMRSPEGSLTVNAPLMKALYAFIVTGFALPGIVYGIVIGKIKGIKDFADILTKSITSIAPFVVIAIIVSQFLYIFNESNLGTIMAINGGELLKNLSVPVVVVIVIFFLLEGVADLFIVSGSARYLIFGPVFVPMMMQLGIHPAFVQMIHRTGGSICNHLTPLNSFFPILLGLAQKYDKKVGIGTVFSAMIPYSIAYTVVYLVMLVLWFVIGLPTGFDTPSHYILPPSVP